MQEENMELKKQKADSCGNYSWIDYMSLPFTQNVSCTILSLIEIIHPIFCMHIGQCGSKSLVIPLFIYIYICPHKVINETLRMANIINGVWRKALKDVEIKGQSFSFFLEVISLYKYC